MASALELRFTDPAAPLFIDIEGDESDGLFVISTSQFQGTSSNSNANTRSSSTPKPQQPGGQKRPRPDNEAQASFNASGSGRGSETPRVEKIKRSMKAVQRTEVPGATSLSKENSTVIKDEHMMPPPSFIPNPDRTQGSRFLVFHASQNGDFGAMDDLDSVGVGDEAGMKDRNTGDGETNGRDSFVPSHSHDPLLYPQLSQIVPPPVPLARERPTQTQRSKTPLFLPLSQLSQQDEQTIRGSGLGIEYMNREELEAMLEGDGDEVEFDIAKDMEPGPGFSNEGEDGGESLDLFEDEFGPTQDGDKDGRKVCLFCLFLRILRVSKADFQAFQPLFED